MSISKSPIFLVDGATGQSVNAFLSEPISDLNINHVNSHWKQWHLDAKQANPQLPHDQSSHWDWQLKMNAYGGQLGFPSYAIECNSGTEGLMLLNNLESCRISSQKGKPLVYIEYLVTAPWNRRLLTDKPRYTAVGSVLVNVAIHVSLDEGFEGRIGLHSLPQADDWYRTKCKLTDLGPDISKQNLRYFEATPEQAQAFIT